MPVTIDPAGSGDFEAMAELLNQIIRRGGTTAFTRPVDAETLRGWMENWRGRNAWTVARTPQDRVAGFQFVEPHPNLPPDTADIASFVRIGATGRGIGRALFGASRRAASALGYAAIAAVIRADNTGGLAYYERLGFQTVQTLRDQTLDNGQIVDRVIKRLELA